MNEWTFVGTRCCQTCNGTGEPPAPGDMRTRVMQDARTCPTCRGNKTESRPFTVDELRRLLA